MAIHIGSKIKEEVYRQEMPVSVFARKINRSRNVVYNIFGRQSIDTALLNKIALVLHIDFFSLYSDQKEYKRESMQTLQVHEEKVNYTTVSEQLKQLEQRNEFLEKENANLRKIVALMEEKYNVKPASKAAGRKSK